MDRQEESLGELAERAMDDKREDGAGEDRARELYDLPSEDPQRLKAEQQGGSG